jgi:hypothetical protein
MINSERYFIPPLLFNVVPKMEPQENGKLEKKYVRVCVDGKQRLTSVKRFMEGHISVSDSSSPPKKWFVLRCLTIIHPSLMLSFSGTSLIPSLMALRLLPRAMFGQRAQKMNSATALSYAMSI